jgi:hypothetical protein
MWLPPATIPDSPSGCGDDKQRHPLSSPKGSRAARGGLFGVEPVQQGLGCLGRRGGQMAAGLSPTSAALL